MMQEKLHGQRRDFGVMENSVEPLKCLKALVHTESARVAEFELAPETEGESHYHSSASEHCVCLQGQLQVKIRGGSTHLLQPGGRLEIPAGVRHQVINIGAVPCQYMVVQCGGAYDFIAV